MSQRISVAEPREINLSLANKAKIFGRHNKLDQFRMTDVSLYSTTPNFQAEYIVQLLRDYYTLAEMKTKVITDATACIGGNSYVFMKYFEHVNFVELFTLHADIFQHNARILGRNNYTINIINYLSICWRLNQDIIFLDPPWESVINDDDISRDLYLQIDMNNVPISDLVYDLMLSAEMIILKVPKDYNDSLICGVRECWFHMETIMIQRTNGAPFYKIIILSREGPKYDKRRYKKMRPIGYKYMKWEYK